MWTSTMRRLFIQKNFKQWLFHRLPFSEDKVLFQTTPITACFFKGLPPTPGRNLFPKSPRCMLFSFHHKWTPKKMLLDKHFLLRLLSTVASRGWERTWSAILVLQPLLFCLGFYACAVEQLAHPDSAGPWNHEEDSSGRLQCQIQVGSQQFSFGMDCYFWSPSLLVLLSELLLEQEQIEEWKGLAQQRIALLCLGRLKEWLWTKRVLAQEKCAWPQEGITSRIHGQDPHHSGRQTCLSLCTSHLSSPHSYLVFLQLPSQGARILVSDCVPSFLHFYNKVPEITVLSTCVMSFCPETLTMCCMPLALHFFA